MNTHTSTAALLANGAKLDWKAMGMGAMVEGTIVSVTTEQCNKYRPPHQRTGPAVPDFWDEPYNTQPKLQFVITLQTQLRDPNVPGDDGTRRIYAKLWGKDKIALRDACLALPPAPSGGMADIPIGGHMRVQWIAGAGGTEDPRQFQFWLWPASNNTAAALAEAPAPAAPQYGQPQPTPGLGYAAPPPQTPVHPAVDPYAPVARDQPVAAPPVQHVTQYQAGGPVNVPLAAPAAPAHVPPPTAAAVQPAPSVAAPPAATYPPPAGMPASPAPSPGAPPAPAAPMASPPAPPAAPPAASYPPAAPPAAPVAAPPPVAPGAIPGGVTPEQLAAFQQAAALAGQPAS